MLAPHVRIIDTDHCMEARISVAGVNLHGTKLSIVSCYSPTEEYADSTKQAFYNNLSRVLREIKRAHSSFKIIACGDFNATIGTYCPYDEWHCVGKFHDPDPTSFNGTQLLEASENNGLYILNTMFATRILQFRVLFCSVLASIACNIFFRPGSNPW